jgi:hypothetical protein
MQTVKTALGILTGVVLILSAGAHTFMGWEALRGELAKTNAPADLVSGLRIGWIWGGVVMLTLGVLTIATFITRLRGGGVSFLAARLTAATYLGFGLWALADSGGDPFFLVFVVPGALLAFASL